MRPIPPGRLGQEQFTRIAELGVKLRPTDQQSAVGKPEPDPEAAVTVKRVGPDIDRACFRCNPTKIQKLVGNARIVQERDHAGDRNRKQRPEQQAPADQGIDDADKRSATTTRSKLSGLLPSTRKL